MATEPAGLVPVETSALSLLEATVQRLVKSHVSQELTLPLVVSTVNSVSQAMTVPQTHLV